MTNSTLEFIRHLTNLSIELEVDGERLRCHAPEGALTPTLRQEIAGRKTEIVLFLQQAKQVKAAHQLSIQPVPRDVELPLSFAQQRLWFLHQLSPDSRSYNMLLILRLEGSLNIVALEQSLGELVCRHEILRTNFPTVDGKPVQRIAPFTALTLPVYDLQGLSVQEQSDRIRQMANSQASDPFDLAVGPLVQFTLLQLSNQKYVLLLKMHHIIYDGWSLNIFNRELSQLYAAFTQGLPNPLPELPIQYADFAVWQRQWLTGEVLERQLNYWQKQLAGVPGVLELPTDKPRPPVQTFRGGVERFQLDHHLTQRLKQLSQESDATLFMTLLAAFLVLISRYSGQLDIVVGSAIANRNNKSVEQLMGFFANTLALRGDLSGNPSFADFLVQVRQTTLSAYSHQDLPFEMLVEKLQPERDLSRNPLVQVMFALQNASLSFGDLPGLTIQNMSAPIDEMVRFDLEVNYWEVSGGLEGVWSYSADLFDATTITRIAQNFQTLLQAIVANPKERIAELPLLTTAERHQLLVEWNNTQVDYPGEKCIHQLFEEQVERTPDAVAVVFENQKLTYRELNQRANKIAHYLKTLDVKPDVLVGICMERSLEMVIGILAIIKAGGAYVPLDPTYPKERLAFMLADAQVSVLLVQPHLVPELPPHQAQVVCIDSASQEFAAYSPQNPINEVTTENLAYVIYTSGSTGKPKGAMNTHKGLCNRLLWMQDTYQLTATDKVLQKTPFSFDVSVWEFFWPLFTGASLIIARPGGHQDSRYLAQLIAQEKITTVHFVPSMLQVFLEETELEKCGSIKRVICSGEALSINLEKCFFERLNAELHNLYGPTEAAIDVTFWACQPNSNEKLVPIGRPIANTQIYILDKHLQPVPIGVSGELHIGGVGLARGYWNKPQLTQEKFISSPFEAGKYLYKTGDLARYRSDGNIEYLGRIDHQVKIRGFRIELGEIEALLASHPDVWESVVMLREDEPGDKRLVAYVVPQIEQSPTVTELRQFLKAKLPEYMIPSAFVLLQSLPLTPNGKVDRHALPKPELDSTLLEKFVAPRTPIEEMLAQIWAQVLKVEQVGIHNNFFELGGHSLLATQLVSRIRNIFKVELPLRSLFAAATVAELAQEIEQLQQQDLELTALPILRRARDAELPLSFAQTRLWFLDQFEPNSAFYNIPFALHIVGTLSVTALEQSLQEIIHRHEALRTNFITVDGQPTQIIQKQTNWTVCVVELPHLPTSEQEIATQQLAKKQAIQPFDLANQALVRATLVVLSETEHVLLLCMHHIVSDGWSMGVFIQELAALYKAYSQGQPSPLAPLPLQYTDFAIWQRQWLQGDVLQSQLNYWQQKLANAPALLSLPTDRPRPAVQTDNGAYQEFALSQKLTGELTQLSQQQGVTLFMTLLAAFDTLLYRYTGQEDILVGSPIANRDRSEIEGLIGFFVNTLVMRSNLAGNPSFSELLGRVREMAMEAYSHQHLPFEMLVEALQPERNLGHTPLFQVMFVLQNAPTSGVELTGLSVSPFPIKGANARFDLTLIMHNAASGLVGIWEYNTDLFDASTIERMTGHFVTLLEGIIANPEQQISQLPLLTQQEQQKLLVEWNDTGVNYPSDKCIHQLFEEQVEHTPNAVAVEFENEQLTYYELNYRANQLADYLRSLGVEADVLVGLCVERSLEMVIGLLGILKAGGAYLPLDPEYPPERLSFVLEDAQVSVLLTQQSLVDRLPQCEEAGGLLAGGRGKEGALSSPASYQAQLVCLDTDAELISQCSQGNLISDGQANNLAYIIYTSGSTGQPKGIAMNQVALCNLIMWHRDNLKIARGAKTLQFASINFDVSFQEIFTTWCSGGTLFLVGEELRRDASALLGFLQQKAVERLFVPFVALQQLAEVAVGSELVNTHLREIITAGEQLQITPAISQWLSRLNDCTLHNHYGPSETHLATSFTVNNSVETWPLLPPIGRPIANTQIYILDKYLQPVPVGVPGELYIAGVLLAQGYFNRSELTQEKFIPNPFKRSRGAEEPVRCGEQRRAGVAPKSAGGSFPRRALTLEATAEGSQGTFSGEVSPEKLPPRCSTWREQRSRGETFNSDRLYKTGDLARYLSDGNIEYLGRIDNQVKIRGFRIELGEIEAVLSQHSHVQASCAIAREDIPGNKRLVAYIVPQKEQTLTVSELRGFLKEKLPEYMVPSAIVILEALPLTPNGKLDRRALPAPDLHSEITDKYVAPRNPIEEILSLIWAQVLKIEQVGIYDNFFELGGHSLLATQLVSRVRTSLKVELPLRSLFAAPTVAAIAQSIGQLQQQDLELTASPIVPRAQNAELPLSFAQTRLWFLDKLNPSSGFYNIPSALRLVGTLEVATLQQSLQEIIHRHEALRTNFITVDGQPTQIIRERLTLNREQGIVRTSNPLAFIPWTVSIIDWQHLPTSEQEVALQQLAQEQAQRPFDLTTEALIRATLVVLSETEHALLMCMHHIVFDGWSMGVFVQELAALYNAYSQGQPSPLTSLAVQYADFAIWQRDWLQGDVLQSQLNYWQQQLANAPALLSLPTDRPRPAVQTFAGAYQQFTLSVELTDRLVKLSQEQGCTLFMTLLAAYDTLLYRYTGQADILVGTPIANRDRSEIEGLIGFFVNTLVMRSNLAGNPSFSELLGRVREVALGAYAHQNLPFEMLVEALQPERDLSYTPLFQVMFALQNASTSQVELTGLTVTPLITEGTTAKFDLTLIMQNTATGLVGFWEYNTDLFDASTIERLTGHFVTLLEGIIANPQQQISQLPLLTAAEQQQLLVEWNDTQADYPSDKCIHQLFEEQCLSTPDAVAVVFEDQQLTYEQLNSRANQLAHYLKSLGVGADVLVGICVERSIEMVVGLLGILKAGGAYLPLDPEYPTGRLHFMLEDAQVTVLLTQQKLVDRLAQHQAKLICLDTDWQLVSQSSQDNLITEAQANNLAYVIYTSGSTGQPKGVLIAHQALLNLVFWHKRAFNITSLDKATQLAGTAFDAAVWELWPYLTAGASIHLVKPQLLSSLVKLRDWLISKKITISFLPTPLAQELLSLEWPTENLALRTILTGGDKLNQYPSDLIPFQVVNNYGPTENTVVTTSGLVVAKEQDQTSPTIGRAIANTQVYILDENLQPVPVGVPGELHIAGVGLAKGYLNRPELTQEKFITNPFYNSKFKIQNSKLYKTGDLARYLPDGNIEYLGRIDNQVKIRGFRIELAEIETLLGQHGDVQNCCVIAHEEIPGNKQLVAYIVPQKEQTCTERSRSTPTKDELRQFLSNKLPGYMVPTAFVMLESLPLTPNGKVDRRALPDPDLHQELSDYVMPNTEAEKIIAGIWQKALQVEKVGIYNNFFELGGHSLLLVKINQQLQEELGLELSIVDMFNYPTIHSLSQYLSTKLKKEDTMNEKKSRSQSYSESKTLRNQQLQSRQQYRSQRKR
ncbi:non-ribosomal peptide synthetase [Brasilonema octagenarum UFV-E1]|uniref:Non-ribosomal peptide synthetase n=1 Tax=Brasilonema sennae CENA114 TaxID=415709 RepID=A0A856MHE6_9CYAN|nr:non-ribosomal peptide synthetase [Brasilonema sennae]QDL09660.1 non-ribosomal peptide synthetase [Brasilonema sennae CENA114]QDL16014.1 non-ribosomal peptide synthetase [Brasilonema octagenarum UFV-E1]